MQAADFFHHALFQALVKSAGDVGAQTLAGQCRPQNQRADVGARRKGFFKRLAFRALDESFYFYRLYDALPFQKIAGNVNRAAFKVEQNFSKLFKRLVRERGAKGGVFRNGNQVVASDNRVDVHSASADNKRNEAARLHIQKAFVKILLVQKDRVLLAQVGHVNQMVGNLDAVKDVVGQVLSASDVQALVDLPAVGGNYFRSKRAGKADSDRGLTDGGGAKENDAVVGRPFWGLRGSFV